MKGIFSLTVFVTYIISLTGCYTIPQHFTDDEFQEIIIYYPEPIPLPEPCCVDPIPPDPPNNNPKPIIRQPETPRNDQGYRDQVRDPLRGNGNRGDNERKTRG